MKDTIINFISPAKKRQQKSRRKDLGSISHTLLFRSGSADWTASPRALNRGSRSKSEKVLNRKSRLIDSERDTVSDDVLLNGARDDNFSNMGSIASGIRFVSTFTLQCSACQNSFQSSSAKSTDTLELLDIANNVDLFEPSEKDKADELAILPGPSGVSNGGSEMVSTNYSSDPMSPIPETPLVSTEDEPEIDNWCDSGNTSKCSII